MSDFTSKLHSLINLLSIPAISNAQVCAVDVFDNDKFKCWQNSGNPLNEIVDLSSSSTVAQWYCQYCKKKFSSLATFQHHERSKKHLQVVGKLSITHKSLSKTPMSPPASTKLDNSQGLLELELKVNETLKIASQNPTLSAIVLWDAAQKFWFTFQSVTHSTKSLVHLCSLLNAFDIHQENLPELVPRWMARILLSLSRMFFLFHVPTFDDEVWSEVPDYIAHLISEERKEIMDRASVRTSLLLFNSVLNSIPLDQHEAQVWHQCKLWLKKKKWTHVIHFALHLPLSKFILLEGMLAGFVLHDLQSLHRFLALTSCYPEETWKILTWYLDPTRPPTWYPLFQQRYLRCLSSIECQCPLIQEAYKTKKWTFQDVERCKRILQTLLDPC